MRAAIEAFDHGSDVALLSKIHPDPQPFRRSRGRHQRGARERLRGQPGDPCLRHGQGLGLPRRPGRGRDPRRGGAGRRLPARELGRRLLAGEDGRIAQRPFGAAGAPRTAFAADITGHVLIQVLYEQVVKRGIRVYEEFFAWKLVEDGGRCVGVIAWDLLRGGLMPIAARGRSSPPAAPAASFGTTTTPTRAPATGWRMALRPGVALKDMEMMQFHPTTLAPTGVLITEGCRGEGAYLLNRDGERFLHRYAPNAMELASRDVISRAEQTEIDAGRGIDGNVMLDLRHLGAEQDPRAAARDARALDRLRRHRPDLRPDPRAAWSALPHGRDRHRRRGRTSLEGLYAAGEVACISVHGANRLGGNALMETITFGRRAGLDAAERRSRFPEREVPAAALARRRGRADGPARPERRGAAVGIRDELGSTMHENFGVFRREEQMEERARIVAALRERFERVVVEDKGEVFNNDLTQSLELGFLLELAECMVVSGLARKESRGAHARPYDFPERDDEHFLATLVVRLDDGHPAQVGSRSRSRMATRRQDLLMQVALKIWRASPRRASAALVDYEVEAPEWATLLDVLDLDQGPPRRDARLPQELPDDDLRLLRDADGRRRRARLQDADERASPRRATCR